MGIINWKELLYPYEQAVEELLLKFRSLEKECRRLGMYSPIDSVSGRLKRPASILDKAGKKQIPPDKIEEKIEDIAGIRILCQFVEDIDKVVQIVRARADMRVVEERDYITNTKPSGYRSYHMIIRYPLNTALGYKEIFAEIQIRTSHELLGNGRTFPALQIQREYPAAFTGTADKLRRSRFPAGSGNDNNPRGNHKRAEIERDS